MKESFCFTPADVLELEVFGVGSMQEWENMSPNELVQKGICPSWVLPSDPVLGRCLPSPPNLNSRSKGKYFDAHTDKQKYFSLILGNLVQDKNMRHK